MRKRKNPDIPSAARLIKRLNEAEPDWAEPEDASDAPDMIQGQKGLRLLQFNLGDDPSIFTTLFKNEDDDEGNGRYSALTPANVSTAFKWFGGKGPRPPAG